MAQKVPVSEIPELLAIWDWEANPFPPESIGKRSDIKVWWICPNGHEHYQQSPHQKTSKGGSFNCPKCNIAKRVQQRNIDRLHEKGPIAITHPQLLAEWDFEKNTISPYDVLAGSHIKIYWKCSKCQKVYIMTPNYRTTKNYGCPKCGIQARGEAKRNRLITRKGSLVDSHPILAAEWNYTLNEDTPDKVHSGMPDKRWWICPMGHESYQQAIRDRVRRGNGCPQCQGEIHTSFPEQTLFYYIRKAFHDAINRHSINGYELDIFIPSYNLGIEYDGLYWHKNKQQREQNKDDFFRECGIKVLHIKEYDKKQPKGEVLPNVIWVPWRADHSYLNNTVKEVMTLLNIDNIDIDIQRDSQLILSHYLTTKKANSLKAKYPEIAGEWDTEHNLIKPEMVRPHSRKKVFWICAKCGHRYEMIIGERTGNRKCGCPKCAAEKRKEWNRKVQEENRKKVTEHRKQFPDATISECSRAIGLSYPTVKKYWL